MLLAIMVMILAYYHINHEDDLFDGVKGSLDQKHPIVIIAIVKNEEMIIEEWLDHYRWQGVDHFYIIDDGSTDRTTNILEAQPDVTLFYGKKRHAQLKYYTNVFWKVKYLSDWIIVVDADEYIYGRKGITIKDYLQSTRYDAIRLSWKMFTSSGFVEQPESIRKSFTRKRTQINDSDKCVKSIVRSKAAKNIKIHKHVYLGKRIVDPEELALNHYAIMSREYFQKVKMTRGDVYSGNNANIRTMEYFHKYDQGDTDDYELRDLVIAYENT